MKTLRTLMEAKKDTPVNVWVLGQKEPLRGKVIEVHADAFTFLVAETELLIPMGAVAMFSDETPSSSNPWALVG